jgi:hypothetical protein
MLHKRGCSFGAEYPWHYESRADGWAVFHAGTDEDAENGTGLQEWEALQLCMKLNGCGKPSLETLEAIDGTP